MISTGNKMLSNNIYRKYLSFQYAYFYFYTVDLQRDMHYADFVVQASTIVHGLKTGNTSKIYN
jgi:hypothetical protein